MTDQELFSALCRALRYECLSYVSEVTEVSVTTLRRWADMKVENPSSRTLKQVASFFGYRGNWSRS